MTLKEFVGKNGKEKCVSKMRQWQSVTIGFINADGKDDETEFDVYRVDTSPVLKSWRSFSTISVLKTISPRTRCSRFVW